MTRSHENRHPNIDPANSATPRCPHFGPCGGCQLQDITYSAQLDGKAEQLRALLSTAALPLPALQLHPSPPYGYRNRIRLTLSVIEGQLRAGYIGTSVDDDKGNDQPNSREPGAHFLPITQCPIAAPILWSATEALLALVNQRPKTWLDRVPFLFDQLELFTNADDSQLEISIFLRTSKKTLPARTIEDLAALCESLRFQVPALIGAGIYLLPPRSPKSRRVEQARPGPTWGTPGLSYTVAPLEPRTSNLEPLTYWVPRGAFFQVNRFLLPKLLALATSNRRKTGLAWDLYAGVGFFTRALAPHYDRITAVEIAEPSFTALASTKLPNRRAVKDTTLDFLQSATVQRERPDLVVLDPPRTGAGREICELLGKVAAPTLIYVSCSPEKLPADLVTLTAAGYRVAEVHLLDLFPQTIHIETVAILTRD
ncbi:MAG: 23S rRNA (uracil(1939)-C(5))-methyltransferase RlmD [Acidobacteriota bacterium]|nr:23S rRNA (uracil(1939)-C(5))-methyltransferase RlmD [Acidobacteriota bacterium]